MIIALQDQRTMTPEMAMTIVAENIEVGNKGIVNTIMETKGSA